MIVTVVSTTTASVQCEIVSRDFCFAENKFHNVIKFRTNLYDEIDPMMESDILSMLTISDLGELFRFRIIFSF